MKRMDGHAITNMIRGATLLGGGGGGAYSSGIGALEQYMERHQIQDLSDVLVRVVNPSEMDATAYAACTAAMGAPTRFKEVQIAPYINGSFEHLRTMARQMNREILYSISVELGGFNTLVPLLVAMEMGIPFVDADGAGRAVPALDTLLINVNGMGTSPIALSDDKGNRVGVELQSDVDAPMGEVIGRNICVAFNQMAGLSGWMMKGNEIAQYLPNGTVGKCVEVGKAIAGADEGNIIDRLNQAGLTCKMLAVGDVIEVHNEQTMGFDKGYVKIKDKDGHTWATHYLNENLVALCDEKPVMTVPDIIGYIGIDSTGCQALSNADIVAPGGRVMLVAIKVDEKWWLQGEDYLNRIWRHYFDILDFPDQTIIKY